MLTMTVRTDALQLLAGLRNAQKRMDYALANALNNTAKAVQREERAQLGSTVQVRKRVFIERQVAIIDFAKVATGKLEAKVSIGQKPRLLLGTLETGGQRPPFKGKRVAVPLTGGPARPTFASPVAEAFTFKQLRLIGTVGGKGTRKGRRRSTRTEADVTFVAAAGKGGVQYKGAHRTFILAATAKAPEGGVYQRVGPGRGDIRMVYSFARNVHLRPVLHWVQRAQQVVGRVLDAELAKQVADTLAHALRGVGKTVQAIGRIAA